MPVSFALKCTDPFTCSLKHATLEPLEEISVTVTFDPAVVDNFYTAQHLGKLEMVYDKGKKSDAINLLGVILRPNLSFDAAQVVIFVRMSQSSVLCKHSRLILDVFNRTAHIVEK